MYFEVIFYVKDFLFVFCVSLGRTTSFFKGNFTTKDKNFMNVPTESRQARDRRVRKIYENLEFIELEVKIDRFKHKNGAPFPVKDFNAIDIINKFGDHPICYLTGLPIDYKNKYSYSLDHLIPPYRGGTNELHNLGLVKPWVNKWKFDSLLPEFLKRIMIIAEYNKNKKEENTIKP